ncbi:MAG: protein kinase [Candidatus Cloacimonetes bacterium]|nr:protein kinase [Candidatus Cloacimonadota bacterium]
MIIDSRYKVEKKLGSGIWATVFKVNDLRTNTKYVLKLFQMLDADSLYERFTAENMHQITKLNHPNLIHVIDFGSFENHVYYISEYYEGKTLSDFKYNKTNEALFYDIIVQICYALSALHSQNIIHKDLKPNNVVYKIQKNQPMVKLMDYGFTKVDIKRTNQRIGNVLPYLAPEIFTGKEAVIQSDFYSLGVMLYQITTGTLPYTVEQLSTILAGDEFNLFPKFPTELNPDIPDELEKIILKLLEKDPKDRFNDAESIIKQINQIQPKQYPFSRKKSIVHNIQFSDYIVREDYSHRLLDYIPIIKKDNGKIISLSASKGLGKSNALTLFRYHLLSDKYYMFDYTCSPDKKDPFFALIKEFYHAAKNNKKIASDLSTISDTLSDYLFSSEMPKTNSKQHKEDLDLDFKAASNFIYHLSEEKPIIFIIRQAEYLDKDVFSFLNYISREVTKRPILIILGINDPRKLIGLMHPVQISIDALTYDQTRKYVSRLLKTLPPEKFVRDLWDRSNGNPMFIEQILIDLINKREIWNSNEFNFDYDIKNYILPDDIQKAIELRIDHLSQTSYRYLKKLACVNTPLSINLIKFILNIDDKTLFFFLSDCLNNELLKKVDEYYFFTFTEVREHFTKEISERTRKIISNKVLSYFKDQHIREFTLLDGIIKHSELVNNFKAVRKYLLQAVELFTSQGKHEIAFDHIVKVVILDFSVELKIAEKDIYSDLNLLIEKSEWATEDQISSNLKNIISNMPDIAEKHMIIGLFYFTLEKLSLSKKRFEQALEKSVTGNLRIEILINLCRTMLALNDLNKLSEYLHILESYQLPEDKEISYMIYKGLYYGFSGRLDDGINLMEDYLQDIKTKNNPNYFIKLGRLHNSLGVLYRNKKLLDEAEKNFEIARNIWERIHYKRQLIVVYNNIGDVALTKGDTTRAFKYLGKASRISELIKAKRYGVLVFLNKGEAHIKLGNFAIAENFLKKAYTFSNKLETKPYLNSIINNMAIAKSKIKNFNYYYRFVQYHVPHLLKGEIDTVTPLIKTFFYYLYDIGDYEKIEQMLKKNETTFFNNQEHEFYYQMLGFLQITRNDYSGGLKIIDKAVTYSKQSKSDYAQTINNIRLAECYTGLGEQKKAIEACTKAEELCEKNQFMYWEKVLELKKIKIKLLDGRVNLRVLLRDLFNLIGYVKDNELYILETEVYGLIIQIYAYLNLNRKAKLFFKRYKTSIVENAKRLPKHDKELYFRKNKYYLKSFKGFKTINIESRIIESTEKWQEELYDILKLKNTSRMKFFIDLTISKLLAPYYYAITLKKEIDNKEKPFLSNNISKEYLYSDKLYANIEEALDNNVTISKKIDKSHILFIPLKIKTAEVGCLIIADKGEFTFQPQEFDIVKNLRLHLTSILIRIDEFVSLNKDMESMSKLIEITRKFFTILSLEKLEQEVVAFTLDFTSSTRGFLIKKDQYENYTYKIAMDDSKRILKNYLYISKSILSEVQRIKHPIYIENAEEKSIFNNYSDITNNILSIYCAPLLVDDSVYGFLYLDNLNSEKNEMQINQNFMKLMLTQISTALKNAQQYELLTKTNQEISSLDDLKKDFINIVSHELKTPLVAMKGYTKLLLKADLPKKERSILSLLSTSSKKLDTTINDIINFNRYQMLKKLRTEPVVIKELLDDLKEEGEKISAKRNMIFRLEIEDKLKKVKVNWNAFYMMLFNIVHNAIRFTKDFGTITIGARYSAFQQEEIEGKESLVVYVNDNGIGIPENEQDKVFQKFYELTDIIAHSSGDTEFHSSGLGLGLSTARLIANLHKGKIWINSKENKGTTVFVAVPFM